MVPSNSSYLSNIAIFQWTMIMGERVVDDFCLMDLLPWDKWHFFLPPFRGIWICLAFFPTTQSSCKSKIWVSRFFFKDLWISPVNFSTAKDGNFRQLSPGVLGLLVFSPLLTWGNDPVGLIFEQWKKNVFFVLRVYRGLYSPVMRGL